MPHFSIFIFALICFVVWAPINDWIGDKLSHRFNRTAAIEEKIEPKQEETMNAVQRQKWLLTGFIQAQTELDEKYKQCLIELVAKILDPAKIQEFVREDYRGIQILLHSIEELERFENLSTYTYPNLNQCEVYKTVRGALSEWASIHSRYRIEELLKDDSED